MSSSSFKCSSCGSWDARYIYSEKVFECSHCGEKTPVEPKVARCFRCGHSYEEYTWFDPSGCPYCHRSFVE